jgi:hypothetical protein
VSASPKFSEINTALVRALPELKPRYDEETAAWGEEMGPHVIYADLLNPYLAELLSKEDEESHAALARVFAFLEAMLAHEDEDYAEVVRTAVAEDLESRADLLDRARPFMGPLMAEATRVSAGPRRPRRLRES